LKYTALYKNFYHQKYRTIF